MVEDWVIKSERIFFKEVEGTVIRESKASKPYPCSNGNHLINKGDLYYYIDKSRNICMNCSLKYRVERLLLSRTNSNKYKKQVREPNQEWKDEWIGE